MIIKNLEAEHRIFEPEDRTPANASILGSMALSFGFNSNHFPALFGLEEQHGYMITKWRTPVTQMNKLQALTNAMTAMAKNYRMDDIPDDCPDFPGCYVAARAVVHASARDYDFAVKVYEDLKAVMPHDWVEDTAARLNAMSDFQPLLMNQALTLMDHQTFEGAICQLIGLKPADMVRSGLMDTRRARDLVKGKEDWRPGEIEGVLLPALRDVSSKLRDAIPVDLDIQDSHLDAMRDLSPALTATAWQLWPTLRPEIETVSEWISVHRPD